MKQQITSVMARQVVTVSLNDTAESVERVMDTQNLSCVPVVNQDGECFGVISAPDLIHFHQARKNPLAEKAWEMCTHQMIEVDTELSIEDAAQLMIDNNIHHLIVSDGQAIKGIVSSLDILRGYLPTESG